MPQIITPPELIPADIDLEGIDGNAFAIIGAVSRALRRAGNDKAVVDAFAAEAMSGELRPRSTDRHRVHVMSAKAAGSVEQIGTVEVLIARTYPINACDPYGASAVVMPGVFKLYRDDLGATYWIMQGEMNANDMAGIRRAGDGMFIMGAPDEPSGIPIEFRSRIFGAEEWAEMKAHPTATEGDPQQRLRIAELAS